MMLRLLTLLLSISRNDAKVVNFIITKHKRKFSTLMKHILTKHKRKAQIRGIKGEKEVENTEEYLVKRCKIISYLQKYFVPNHPSNQIKKKF